jgi:hypothetical protein
MVGSDLGRVISNPHICKRNILALMCYLAEDHQISKSYSNGLTACRGLTGGDEKQIPWSRWEAGEVEMESAQTGKARTGKVQEGKVVLIMARLRSDWIACTQHRISPPRQLMVVTKSFSKPNFQAASSGVLSESIVHASLFLFAF